MKTITLNIAEGGIATASEQTLGRAGEHFNSLFHILINDTAFSECDFFRIWLGNKFSEKLTATEGQIEYPVPIGALIPPLVNFELTGYKIIEGEICQVAKSSMIKFSVFDSASVVPIDIYPPNPYEQLVYEAGQSAKIASEESKKTEVYFEQTKALSEGIETYVNTAIEQSLQAAKDSGEFKGEKGDCYILTNADKEEIADLISADLESSLDKIIEIQNTLIGGNL